MATVTQTTHVTQEEVDRIHEILAFEDLHEVSDQDKRRLGIGEKDALVFSRTIHMDDHVVIDFDVPCSKSNAWVSVQAFEKEPDGSVYDPFEEGGGGCFLDGFSCELNGTTYLLAVEISG